MTSLFNRSIVLILGLSVISCVDNSKPNYQYMPNMYETVSYEPYGEYGIFENGQEAKLPADGSIPRGWEPYEYENSNEGYAAAKAELENPLPYTEDNVAAGRQLYTIYCAVCHGDNGDGQGILVEREKILGIPSYDTRDITEGSTYHVQYYGLNAMGSYASQTSIEERWQITHYVMDLRDQLLGNPEREFEDDMEAIAPAVNSEGDITEGETTGEGQSSEEGETSGEGQNSGQGNTSGEGQQNQNEE